MFEVSNRSTVGEWFHLSRKARAPAVNLIHSRAAYRLAAVLTYHTLYCLQLATSWAKSWHGEDVAAGRRETCHAIQWHLCRQLIRGVACQNAGARPGLSSARRSWLGGPDQHRNSRSFQSTLRQSRRDEGMPARPARSFAGSSSITWF